MIITRESLFLGVRHNTVEDGVDRTLDVVLGVLVYEVRVVNHVCVHLMEWAQGVVGAESEGTGITNVVPWDLAR